MKRTLAFLLVAVAGSALAQTPTVVEKPAAKPAVQTKAAPKAPAQNSKAPVTAVKVVAISAQKPVVVAAKPSAVPAHAATKPGAVSAAKPTAVSVRVVTAKPVAVSAAKPSAPSVARPMAVAVPVKPVVAAAPAAHTAVVTAKPVVAQAPKPVERSVKSVMVPVKVNSASATKAAEKASGSPVAVPLKSAEAPQGPVAVQDTKADAEDKTAKAISPGLHRDPFVSPVVNMGATGSGCSSGKRCLAIDEVALKGVVKSDAGMIAVVVNSLDKAYFLRENDPVFNGYVLKITGDSIVFKETFRDKLGKPLTRDVTKTISRPVA